MGRVTVEMETTGEGATVVLSRIGVEAVVESLSLNSLGESMVTSSDESRVRLRGLSMALPLRTTPSYQGLE